MTLVYLYALSCVVGTAVVIPICTGLLQSGDKCRSLSWLFSVVQDSPTFYLALVKATDVLLSDLLPQQKEI